MESLISKLDKINIYINSLKIIVTDNYLLDKLIKEFLETHKDDLLELYKIIQNTNNIVPLIKLLEEYNNIIINYLQTLEEDKSEEIKYLSPKKATINNNYKKYKEELIKKLDIYNDERRIVLNFIIKSNLLNKYFINRMEL